MSIEASAEALAPEPIEPPQVPETPEIETDDDVMERIWSENNPDEAPEAEAVETPEPEPAPEQPEPEPEVEAAPTSLPGPIKDKWADIPQEARDAISKSHTELTTRLGEQGRLMQGIRPIQEVLNGAIEKFPALKDSKPEDVAREVFRLAEYEQKFTEKPVETIMSLIKEKGLEQQVAQAFSGQPAPEGTSQIQSLQQHIKELQGHIKQITDPEYLREQVTNITSSASMEQQVYKFAETADHWSDVEPHMPMAIQFTMAKLGEGAAAEAVLSEAYELAVSQFVPEAKAKPQAAEPAAQPVDPEKTQAQLKAKSVNVQSKSSGKVRDKTEREIMEAVWNKHNS